MYIRDPLFGNIALGELENDLIETSDFQRLRYIKQLGFAFLVYPGATHTRFEHSLGTFYVTGDILRSAFGMENKELEIAALLHDIGHGPFSHQAGGAMYKFLKTNHEKVGEEKITHGEIKDILEKHGLSTEKIIRYYKGNGLGELITGALGSDRIDYLMRDALHVGVAYGVIDYNRIKGKITSIDEKPAIYEEGIQGAESLLISRYFMHSSVYKHHAVTIANLMYAKALDMALENSAFDAKELLTLTDDSVLGRMGGFGESKVLMDCVLSRNLFKRAYYGNVNAGLDVDALEEAIGRSGIKNSEYVINLSKVKGYGDDIVVVNKKKEVVGKLSEISPLVKTLMELLEGRTTLLVAVKKEHVGDARDTIHKVLID